MASTVWRGYVSFGLISIPVRLFRAARPERISLRRLYRKDAPQTTDDDAEPRSSFSRPSSFKGGDTGEQPSISSKRTAVALPDRADFRIAPEMTPERVLTPVKQVSVQQGTEQVVAPQSVVKGYEYEKNRFVALEPEELKTAVPTTSAAMEIQEFVPLTAIDPVFFETSYYVTPEEAGEKAYALLYRSLQLSALVAIAQFAMHGREHVVVLRPGKSGILAHTMYFAAEVRAEEEFRADVSAVNKKELDLAQTLIHSLAGSFEPEKYRDTYREKVQALIDKKVKGEPVSIAPSAPRQADVIDIADALRKSLANLKKPAASEAHASKGNEGKGAPRAKRAARES